MYTGYNEHLDNWHVKPRLNRWIYTYCIIIFSWNGLFDNQSMTMWHVTCQCESYVNDTIIIHIIKIFLLYDIYMWITLSNEGFLVTWNKFNTPLVLYWKNISSPLR